MKKVFHANEKQKKAVLATLISDKIGFKIKTVSRDKEGHHLIIKGSIQEENIRTVNIYSSNIEAPQYTRQVLTAIKREMDSNTTILKDFNTPLTSTNHPDRNSIKKHRS